MILRLVSMKKGNITISGDMILSINLNKKYALYEVHIGNCYRDGRVEYLPGYGP